MNKNQTQIQYRIPITNLKFSTNRIYAGVHWSKRKEIKDVCCGYARAFCRPIQKIESYPVSIRYRFFFRKRPLDTTNTTALVKMFEDSLMSLGIIENDSPKFVAQTIIEVPLLSPKKNKKADNAQRTPAGEENEDWLEITINPYKTAFQDCLQAPEN